MSKDRKEQVADRISKERAPSVVGYALIQVWLRLSIRRPKSHLSRLGWALLLLLFLTPLLNGQDYRRNLVMRPATKLLSENRVEEAIAVLEEVAKQAEHPDDQAYYLKEASDIARGRLKDEARAMRLAQAIPEPMRSQSQQLVVLAGGQRWQDIISRFGDVDIGTWPETWRQAAYLARSEAWLQSGNTNRAEQDLKDAIDAYGPIVPRGRACQRLGDLYQNTLKDPERALEAYRKGLSLTEATYAWHCETFLSMIGILKELGRYDEAVAAFKTVDYRKLNDRWLFPYYMAHADVLRLQGSIGQAATQLTTALRLGNLSDSARKHIESELDQLISVMWENQ